MLRYSCSNIIIVVIAILKIIIVMSFVISDFRVSGESVRARLKKKRGVEGGRSPPRGGGWGGRSPPHLQMAVILVGILIYSNSTGRRRSDSRSRRRCSD